MRVFYSLVCRFGWVGLAVLFLPGCSQEARVAVRLDRGDQYYAARDYGRAEIEYLSVLQREPTNSLALKRVGLINYHRGILPRAYTFLDQARQQDANDLEIRLRLAAVYQSIGQLPEAREQIKFVLDQAPETDDALLQLAESAMTPEMIAETEGRLESMRASSGNRPFWHLAMANLAFRQGDFEAGAVAIDRALELAPDLSAARIARGTLFWLEGDLAQAERELALAVEHAPPYSVRSLKLAEFKWRTGDLDSAAALLREIVAKTPDYLPAWSMTADIAFEQQRWDDCEAAVRRVLTLDAVNHNSLVMRAALGVTRGDRTRAIAELNRMLEIYPQSARAHYTLGLAHALNQDATRGIESLRRAVELDPADVRASILLSDIHIRRATPEPAIALLRQLLERYPGQVTAQLLLASAYRLQGVPGSAVQVYETLLTERPEDPQILYLLGSTLREADENDAARRTLTRALDLAPDHLLALDQMVELDLAAGLTNAALERVQSEIGRRPEVAGAYFLLAKVHTARHEMDPTEAALLRGLELAPDFAPGYQMLAQLYSGSDRVPQAIAKLEALGARNPDNLIPLMQAAQLQTQTEQYGEAARIYNRILEVDPEFYPALNNLAYIETEFLNNLERAYDLARRAHNLQPGNPATLDTFGWVMVRRGEVAQALPFLREAAQKAENNPEIQYHLGVAYYLLAQPEPARRALERALAANVEFIGKPDAERRLAVLRDDPADPLDAAALAALEQQVADQPGDLLSLFRLANARVLSGNAPAARELYQHALKRDPKNAQLLVRLAVLELDTMNQPARALELARQARALSPSDPELTAAIGRIARRGGDYTTALAVLQETVQRAPQLAGAQLDLALTSYALGQQPTAERALQQALKVGPGFVRHEEAADFDFLLRTAQNPAISGPDSARLKQLARDRADDLAVLMAAGNLLEQQDRAGDAAQYYQRAIALSPMFAPAYPRLARAYAIAPPQNQAQVTQFIQQARQTFPNNADIAKQLGILQYERKQFADAVQLLDPAANTLRTDGETHLYLGLAQAQLKDADRAKANLNRALSLNLSADRAHYAQQALNQLE